MSRRSKAIADFAAEVSHAGLLSYLVPADESLDHAPLLRSAVAYWRAGVKRRRHFCCACRRSFVGETKPAAFLLATPAVMATSASVSAICVTCWTHLTDAEIEAAATRVLRRLAGPGARLEGAWPP